jgi:hypothetical protein
VTSIDRNADLCSGDESDNDDISDETSESEWSDTGQFVVRKAAHTNKPLQNLLKKIQLCRFFESMMVS